MTKKVSPPVYEPRTKEEILAAFDAGFPKFRWFIEKHFHFNMIVQIERAREEENTLNLLNLLNTVWFYLPDNQFNVRCMPKGWTEFLNVIEV